ncbi:MAG: hypothetical protein ACAF41_26200 [Leptolyngbya sp. BL-A-14]
MNGKQAVQFDPPLGSVRHGIWLFGLSAWAFGILDRSLASVSDGHFSGSDALQLLMASFFFVCWLSLKPARQKDVRESGEKTL